jgi:hypothetical protein
MRLVRLLVSATLIFLAVATKAQQAAAPTGPTLIVVPPPGAHQTSVAPPQHPATEAQLREYFALTNFARVSHGAMSNVIRAQRATAPPYLPSSFWDDMNDAVNKLDVVAVNTPIYQEYLSEEDLTAILAFYHSPAGKKLLEEQPVIISAAQVIMRARGEAIGKAVYLRHKEEIDAAKKAFDAEHPTPNTK